MANRLLTLRQRLHEGIPDEAKKIREKAEAENRDLSADDLKKVEDLKAEKARVSSEIQRIESLADLGHAPNRTTRTTPGADPGPGSRSAEGLILAYTNEGSPVYGLGPKDRLSDLFPAQDNHTLQLGQMVKGYVTGNWEGISEHLRIAALQGAESAGGGLLLSPFVAAPIIDLARSKARTIQAGAVTIVMPTRDVRIVRLATEPAPAWRAENKSLPVGDPTFDGVTLSARTLGGIVKTSIELIEDAANVGAFVEHILAETIALELDRAALLGLGAAEEPLGVENTAGIQTITSVGSPTDYSKFSDAIFKVQEQNGEANAMILAPRTLNSLDKLEDTTGQPLQPPPSWATVRKFSTNQVPVNRGAGSNESLAFTADWSNLWIGIRTQLTLEASRHPADSSGSAFRDLQVWIRGYARADVAVIRPKHFVLMSGILA